MGAHRLADLKEKMVLVTGAAGAIGAAVVAAVKRAGGMAIATDLGRGAGIDAELDVTAEADWQRVTADIERKHGRLDGLVNAAGIVVLGSVEQLDFATWRRVLSVNLDGAFLGCKYSFPLLRKKGGAIVNLSSVSGLVGGHNLAAYNASKGGLSLLTKSVALTRRALQAAGALQRRLPGLPRRSDGGRHRARRRAIPTRCIRSCRSTFRSAASASRPRSPISAFICCRTPRPSSPAPICRSTAG